MEAAFIRHPVHWVIIKNINQSASYFERFYSLLQVMDISGIFTDGIYLQHFLQNSNCWSHLLQWLLDIFKFYKWNMFTFKKILIIFIVFYLHFSFSHFHGSQNGNNVDRRFIDQIGKLKFLFLTLGKIRIRKMKFLGNIFTFYCFRYISPSSLILF